MITDSLTNSAAGTWRACRRKYKYRYVDALVPRGIPKAHALRFGSLLHAGLETWFRTGSRLDTFDYIKSLCTRDDVESLIAYHTAQAMLVGYIAKWGDLDKHIVFSLPEQDFDVPITNPATGRTSRSFTFRGKLDLPALYADGAIRIMEHKTAATIDGQYLERLWCDTQITGYVAAARALGVDVSQVVYDVIRKPGIKLGQDETVDHYAARLRELYVGGYSAGKCKRRKAETDDEWWQRRREEGTPVEMFHREVVIVGEAQIREWQADLWDVSQEILWARQNDRWPRSTARCYDYGRACEYAPICQSLGSEQLIIEMDYERAGDVHPELDGGDEEAPF